MIQQHQSLANARTLGFLKGTTQTQPSRWLSIVLFLRSLLIHTALPRVHRLDSGYDLARGAEYR